MRTSTALQPTLGSCAILLLLSLLLPSPAAQNLADETSNLFAGSGSCTMCHSAFGGAFTTPEGKDISPPTLWRSTMMANAAKDPLWQAKVTAEVAEHPALKAATETKCATCHMPMGKTEATHDGAFQFLLGQGQVDPLSMDGVSCTLCHQVQQANLGKTASFSGGYEILESREIFGPFSSPLTMPMLHHSGYLPVHSDHVEDSELCGTCHTLFTPYLDNEGRIVGEFPEQTTYLEWRNSAFAQGTVECQTCHMPQHDASTKLSSMPPWFSTLRSPIHQHRFVGANAFMNRLLKQHGPEIGVTASDDHFDQTFSRTMSLLQQHSVGLAVDGTIAGKTLKFKVTVTNLAGHKFPTGFPSRRAWLHVTVTNTDGDSVFESGNWGENGEIVGLDPGFEPHHQTIHSPDQIPVYQSVMLDVNDNVTYTLLRGARYAKDNRLPPKGFSTDSGDYPYIGIKGRAVDDVDFNRGDDVDGSGTDFVHYQVPISDLGDEFGVHVEMRYQTLSPRFAQSLFKHESGEIDRFRDYYEAADREPILVTSVSARLRRQDGGNKGDLDDSVR